MTDRLPPALEAQAEGSSADEAHKSEEEEEEENPTVVSTSTLTSTAVASAASSSSSKRSLQEADYADAQQGEATSQANVIIASDSLVANAKRLKSASATTSTDRLAHEVSTTPLSNLHTAPVSSVTTDTRLETMTRACKTILECLGEDPNREGLIKTPDRWAKAFLHMCSGYHQTPDQVIQDAVFEEENHKEMVVVRNIDIHSLCEHHMLPFSGKVHIGYIPNGKILGLSKLARVAQVFARRLQVQERLTRQIADAIVEAVEPLGVAVVVECTHYCMVMRGVEQAGAVTTTSSVRGCFESNPKTRAEFFSILHGNAVHMC
jgi:GTP cyclohydrolase IA